jgi:hypothetical protein
MEARVGYDMNMNGQGTIKFPSYVFHRIALNLGLIPS